MIRQYRIDRYNGQELLVCEVFRRHTFTQLEQDALFKYREHERENRRDPEHFVSVYDFRCALSDFLEQKENYDEDGKLVRTFFGLSEPIAVYDSIPCIIIRGVVYQNRIASLAVDYKQSVLLQLGEGMSAEDLADENFLTVIAVNAVLSNHSSTPSVGSP